MNAARITTGLIASAVAALIAGCGASAADPQTDTASADTTETLTPLYEQVLPNVADKTFTSVIVTFPPAARAVPHRHGDAFVYAYVLEGTVNSQLEGEQAHVYRQGENWSEPPGAHHLATENASATEPAKLLVVFIATTGEQLKVDDAHT
jgi:quercetin dioxygenase-like cupin family protein